MALKPDDICLQNTHSTISHSHGTGGIGRTTYHQQKWQLPMSLRINYFPQTRRLADSQRHIHKHTHTHIHQANINKPFVSVSASIYIYTQTRTHTYIHIRTTEAAELPPLRSNSSARLRANITEQINTLIATYRRISSYIVSSYTNTTNPPLTSFLVS